MKPTLWAAPGATTIHMDAPGSATNLAWCGVRRQFRHRSVQAPAPTCRRCLTAIQAGRPRAWRS